VDSGTPGYQSRFFGSALRSVGIVPAPDYPSVTNYNPSANALQGCIVAVEGCMDANAVNYNPAATVNSNTWCIPKVNGCMMPPLASVNFDVGATVDTGCIARVPGCMSTEHANYEPRATDTPAGTACYPFRVGCLISTALNFGCTAKSNQACGQLDGNNVLVNTDGSAIPTEGTITYHDNNICVFDAANFASPEALADEANANRAVTLSTTMVLSGTLSDFDNAKTTKLVRDFDNAAGTQDPGSSVLLTAGSVVATFSTPVAHPAAARAAQSTITAVMGTASSSSAILGVQVLTAPTTSLAWSDSATVASSDNIGATVGGAVGGAFGGIMFLGLMFYLYKKRQTKSLPVVPA